MADLNYFVILITAIVSMVLGMVWYSKSVFGNIWIKYQDFSVEEMEMAQKEGMGKTMIIAFVMQLVIVGAFNYTLNISGVNPFCIALLFAIGVIMPVLADGSLWEKKHWNVFWIGFSYRLTALLVTATVFYLI